MNWTLVVIGLVVVLGFFGIVGLVKSLLRLVVALIVGILAAMATAWALQTLGLSETVPGAVPLVVGTFASLTVLIKR